MSVRTADELELFKRAAEVIASELIKKDHVRAIHIALAPHDQTGRSHLYAGPDFRFFVVVDDETAARFLDYCANPRTVHYQDGTDDPAVTWWEERPETVIEAAWSLLDVHDLQDFFRDLRYRELNSEWVFGDLYFSECDLEVIPVRSDWAANPWPYINLERSFEDGEPPLKVYDAKQWQHAIQHHEIFDPEAGKFVARS